MKFKKVFSVLMVFAISLIYLLPINIVYASENDEITGDTLVTFGVRGIDGGIIGSQEVPFKDSYSFGICTAIRNFYFNEYSGDVNFPSSIDPMLTSLNSLFPSGFFDELASNGWLMNVYGSNMGGSTKRLWLVFSRNSLSSDPAEIVSETSLNGGYDLNFLPDVNSSVCVICNSELATNCFFCYAPYFSLHVSDSEWQNNLVRVPSREQNSSLDDFVSALSALDVRAFYVSLRVNTPSLTFSSDGDDSTYISYLDSSSNSILGRVNFQLPLVSQFPVYFLDSFDPVYNVTLNGIVYKDIKPQDITSGFVYNADFDFPILSVYVNLNPVPSPSPFPSITLVPSVTPIPPVDAVEGLGQMFTLFTRKYEVNINGANIGIRPLYLFLACFFVGMIFRVFQGGNSE